MTMTERMSKHYRADLAMAYFLANATAYQLERAYDKAQRAADACPDTMRGAMLDATADVFLAAYGAETATGLTKTGLPWHTVYDIATESAREAWSEVLYGRE